MLSFNNTPGLTKDPRRQQDILTPPLTEDFNFTATFKDPTTYFLNNTWDYPNTALGVVPVNSMATSPRDENQLTSTANFESLQLGHDIYHSATTPGSGADQQQWLHDSLCACLVSPQNGEWYHSGSPGVLTGVK